MSFISGAERTLNLMSKLPDELEVELVASIKGNLDQCQVEAVQNVPVHEGNLRDLLASPEALLFEKRAFGPFGEFGFRTLRLQKKGFYALWVEQGNKAHKRGEISNPGVDGRSKSGRRRTGKRRKRGVPARPAQPFFRPAFERMMERLARARNEIAARAVKRVREDRSGWW